MSKEESTKNGGGAESNPSSEPPSPSELIFSLRSKNSNSNKCLNITPLPDSPSSSQFTHLDNNAAATAAAAAIAVHRPVSRGNLKDTSTRSILRLAGGNARKSQSPWSPTTSSLEVSSDTIATSTSFQRHFQHSLGTNFRKLPRAYRSPSSTSGVVVPPSSSETYSEQARSVNSNYSPSNTQFSQVEQTGLKVKTRAKSGSIGGPLPSFLLPRFRKQAKAAVAVPSAKEMDSSVKTGLLPVTCPTRNSDEQQETSVPIKPHRVLGLAAAQSSSPSIPSSKDPSIISRGSTASSRVGKRSKRGSLQILREKEDSAHDDSNKPLKAGYIPQSEIDFGSETVWDKDKGAATTNSTTKSKMPSKWKTAFGRARGKSIEGSLDVAFSPSSSTTSPNRRGVFASKSQTDLTLLQKLFKEDSIAERAAMPPFVYRNTSSERIAPSSPLRSPLRSPLMTAAKEEHDMTASRKPVMPTHPPSANQYHLPRRQTSYGSEMSSGELMATLSSRPFGTAYQKDSFDQASSSQFADFIPLQPRQKRQKPRQAGDKVIRPGSSRETSSRTFTNPLVGDISTGSKLQRRPQTSSGALQSTSNDEESSSPCHNKVQYEISPRRILGSEQFFKREDRSSLLSPEHESDLNQRKPATATTSSAVRSPLFASLWENEPNDIKTQPTLLSAAQISEDSTRRLSSSVKVNELRRRMQELEQAMAFTPIEQSAEAIWDTPQSSFTISTANVSSGGPQTPTSNQLQAFNSTPTLSGGAENPIIRDEKSNQEEEKGGRGEDDDDDLDRTVVLVLPQDNKENDKLVEVQSKTSQQESLLDLYCDTCSDTSALLAPDLQERRGSNQSAASYNTLTGRTDSTASYSLDAEFWLVQAAEKRVITARTARSATLPGGSSLTRVQKKDSVPVEEPDEKAIDDGPVSRPASIFSEQAITICNGGLNIVEGKEMKSLRVEVKWEATSSAHGEDSTTSGVIVLSDEDVEQISRAWFRRKKSRLSLLSSDYVQDNNLPSIVARQLDYLPEPEEDKKTVEQRAREQRHEEILRTSTEWAGVFRVHSAPAYVRSGHSSEISSRSAGGKFQRKPLVLATRVTSDQSISIEEPLRSDGSMRRFLHSPATTNSSRPSSPRTEIQTPKNRPSIPYRSPNGPTPLRECDDSRIFTSISSETNTFDSCSIQEVRVESFQKQ